MPSMGGAFRGCVYPPDADAVSVSGCSYRRRADGYRLAENGDRTGSRRAWLEVRIASHGSRADELYQPGDLPSFFSTCFCLTLTASTCFRK